MKINDLNFRTVSKDRLYYDQWKYSMTFCLSEASCLRELNHEFIDHALEGRRKWRQIIQERRRAGQNILSVTSKNQEITEQTSSDLHTVATVLLNNHNKFKCVVSINTVWVYTNDLELLELLSGLSCITAKKFTQALVKKPRNTVLLKNPVYTHRTYFRMKKLTLDQKHSLVKFLQNQQDFTKPSPSLTSWLPDKFLRLQDYFFIDHNGMAWVTMLSLVQSGLVRKTMQIQQAK